MASGGLGMRGKMLVFLVPSVLALVALGLAWNALATTWRTVPGQAVVARVEAIESTAPWSRGTLQYVPTFLYTWSDGAETLATPGLRHKDWNFPVGSEHTIRYNPDWKGDIVLPGPHNWTVAAAIGGLAIITALPSFRLMRRLARTTSS